MATFNPYNKAVKETINVDFRTRHSPQKVILCHPENIFYGKFIGNAQINNTVISGGQLVNVDLSNVNIYDKDGNLICLSDINEQLSEIKYVVDEQFPEISGQVVKNTSDISSLSDIITSLSGEVTSESAYFTNLSVSGMAYVANTEIDNANVWQMSAQTLSIDQKSLVFGVGGNTTSSMMDISSAFHTRIENSGSDISSLSGEYHKTLVPSKIVSEYEYPNCLILRDYALPEKSYVLRVISGMLSLTEFPPNPPEPIV